MSAPQKKENLAAVQDTIEYYNTSTDLPDIDLTGAKVVIDYPHHEVHEGNFYTLSSVGTIAAGTANAVAIALRPEPGRTAHFQGIVSAKNSGYAELYENVVVVPSGTVTPKNNDRTSPNVWGGTIVTVSSVTSFGTLLQSRAIGSAAPGTRIGGDGTTRNEWILSSSYWYLVWFYADNADTQITLDSEFYDEVDYNA